MKFFILECISFNNICRHANIFHHLIVNSQWSDQSDNDTRIWYYGWVQTKKSLQAPPPFFASPGYTQLALLTDFLIHPAIHGSHFTGYVIWRLDREKGILALVVTIISCPPPPPDHICQVYYSRTSIIQTIKISDHRKLHEHWCGLPRCYFYHFKGRLPTTIAKMHCHLWNSK